MAALSALVFSLSWWLGLYLLARDPRKPVLVLAAVGLCSFAAVVALDAVRLTTATHAELLSRIEIYLVVVPGVALGAVAALALVGATLAGGVEGPLRFGHWLMFAVISVSSLAAMARAVMRRP